MKLFERKPDPARIDYMWETACLLLGPAGKMRNGSKQAPQGEQAVWNGNVCVKDAGKIWYGDIYLNADATKLQSLADQLGEWVYVLYERDARFGNEAKPLYDQAVCWFEPKEKS
jgi:hypothetical protein